ncbi:uncharacterized protein LOC131948299 [Physella acuta]|uniref:uncharacterized protein LOC131948299 n=1 Tax=Physella acuta TaxID=109671 RepID=UPI0027DCDD64|nr:uncharacterized protein LOC131948299 [Physella acuta]
MTFVVVLCLLQVLDGIVGTGGWFLPNTVETASGRTKFILVKNKVSWRVAFDACKNLGASLTRVDTPAVQRELTSFANNQWINDWDEAWISLVWHQDGTTQTLVWADACQTANTSQWANFEKTDDAQYTNGEECYSLDKLNLKWNKKNCAISQYFLCTKMEYYNFSKTEGYEPVDIALYPVRPQAPTSEDCNAFCDRVFGCFMTSFTDETGCVLALINSTTKSFVKSDRIIAEVSNISVNDLASIDQSTTRTFNACDTSVITSSLPDGYIFIEGIQVSLSSSCTTETLTVSAQPTELPTLPCSSTPEAGTTSTPTCTPNVAAVNLTNEQKDAMLSSIVDELTINAKTTSVALLRYTSAEDKRTSAHALGFIAVGVLTVVFCIILFIDAPNLYLSVQNRIKGSHCKSVRC